MDFAVIAASAPIPFEALPTIKTRHLHGQDCLRHIYSLGRLYLLDGAPQLSLSAFEREPSPGSRVAAAFGVPGGPQVFVRLCPKEAAFALFQPGDAIPLPGSDAGAQWQPLAASRMAGVDEQGWYWGANFSLSDTLLPTLGMADAVAAGLFTYQEGGGDYALSFPPPAALSFAALPTYPVIRY